jgi:hypothetical protein
LPTSPEEMMKGMMKGMMNNLVKKTGTNLNHWIALVKSSDAEKHMAIIK